jgi:O-antigen/teichoic acid export membrane protein
VKFSANSILLVKYYYYLIPAAFFYLLFVILKSHLYVRLNAALPTFFEDIGYKVFTIVILLLYYFKIINFNWFVLFFCCYYFLASIPLYIKLKSTDDFRFNFKISKVTRRFKWKLISYTLFIYVGVIIGELGEYIAPIFVSSYKGLSYTAVLSVALYMVSILTVPQKALFGVSISILSDAWKRKDNELIEKVYKKTSLNMMIIGLLIFVSIWLSIDQLLSFLPPEYLAAKPVILLMSAGKLFDLACGINNELLSTSNYWKFNFTSHILLLFLLIPLNAILINKYGLMGSAYANVISLTVYNSLRFWFIYVKFKLQPFSAKTLLSLVAVAILYFTINFIPVYNSTLISKIITMISRSGLFVILFTFCIIRFKLSEDLYTLYHQILNRAYLTFKKRG